MTRIFILINLFFSFLCFSQKSPNVVWEIEAIAGKSINYINTEGETFLEKSGKIYKYDKNGNLLWSNLIDTVNMDESLCIYEQVDDTIYLWVKENIYYSSYEKNLVMYKISAQGKLIERKIVMQVTYYSEFKIYNLSDGGFILADDNDDRFVRLSASLDILWNVYQWNESYCVDRDGNVYFIASEWYGDFKRWYCTDFDGYVESYINVYKIATDGTIKLLKEFKDNDELKSGHLFNKKIHLINNEFLYITGSKKNSWCIYNYNIKEYNDYYTTINSYIFKIDLQGNSREMASNSSHEILKIGKFNDYEFRIEEENKEEGYYKDYPKKYSFLLNLYVNNKQFPLKTVDFENKFDEIITTKVLNDGDLLVVGRMKKNYDEKITTISKFNKDLEIVWEKELPVNYELVNFVQNSNNEFYYLSQDSNRSVSEAYRKTYLTKIASETQVKFYPNPTKDNINIETFSDVQQIELYDLNGKLIFKTNENIKQLSLENYPSGMYVLKVITSNHNNNYYRIIKN